jgi:hypothetical protein
MELACTACGANFQKEDLNFDYGIATCRYCHAVTRLRLVGEPAERPRERPQVPQPKGVTVDDLGHTFRITRRWFSPVFIFLLFFCIVWDGFLVFWYTVAVGADAPGAFRIFACIFPILHVAVGVGLTYFTIAGFLNRTVIQASDGLLTVRHGPVPWSGNHDIPTDDLDQLYCEERIHRGKNSTSTSYRLHAVLKDGRKLKLLDNVQEPDQALFIEQQLENHLRIPNREITGEYRT